MFKSLQSAWNAQVQFQQIRLGHRIRGKAPIFSKTIKQRLAELNYKDEYYTRIDIGFARPTASLEVSRGQRIEHIKKSKNDKTLEQLARSKKLNIDMGEARKEWLNSLAPYHKKTIAEHYAIFEHLYGEGYFVPYTNLEAHYDLKNGSFLPVCYGNVIKPSEALESPLIHYESDNSSLWTLALTSLDGHMTENDKEYVHWLVANIPGNAVNKGDTIVEYLRPFPLKGTGYHRYVYVLYKQDGKVSYEMPPVTSSSLENRTFVTRDWYQKYQENITPSGLAFFQCDWDVSVRDFFHSVLNSKEPVFEYDFPEPYIRPQEWFPLRKPFNLYMDKYRDPKQINKEYLLRKLKDEDPFKKPPAPLKFANAQPFPPNMPSWLKLHEKKIRLRWGRVNDV